MVKPTYNDAARIRVSAGTPLSSRTQSWLDNNPPRLRNAMHGQNFTSADFKGKEMRRFSLFFPFTYNRGPLFLNDFTPTLLHKLLNIAVKQRVPAPLLRCVYTSRLRFSDA